jgi:hypothetical protein
MIKLNRNQIKEIKQELAQWQQLSRRIKDIEDSRAVVLKPFMNDYALKTATIRKVADELLAPLTSELEKIEKSITTALKSGIDDDGNVSLKSVSIDGATADVEQTKAAREIRPREFFDAVKPEAQNDAFWNCVSVGVGPAEKLIGEVVDSISTLKRSFKVVVKLKGS